MLPQQPLIVHFLADTSGRWLQAGGSWRALTGLDETASLGDGWLQAIHAADSARISQAWQSAVATSGGFSETFRLAGHANEGRRVHAAADRTAMDGNYLGSWTLAPVREADEKVKLYEAVLSTSPDFAYIFDTNYKFIYANESLLRTWGVEDALGKGLDELGYPDWHIEKHHREIDTVIHTKGNIRSEVPFTGVNGEQRIYDYFFTPVIGEDGEVVAVAGTTRDVTERKERGERTAFLATLAGKLADLTSEEDIVRTTLEAVGKHLRVHRCHFVECMKSENLLKVGMSWTDGDGKSVAGDYRLTDYGGEEWWELYSSGNLAIEDTRVDPLTVGRWASYEEVNVIAFTAQPFKRPGPATTVLAVTQDSPRRWTREELGLLENVVARVWPLVEQARDREAISKNQQRMALLAEAGRVILEAETPASMLGRMGETAAGYLQAEIFLILTASSEAGVYQVEYCAGLEARVVEEMGGIYLTPSESRDDVPGGKTDANERLAKADAEARRLLAGMGVRVFSSHPLLAGEDLLGVMIFASRDRGSFSETEEEFMETLSHYVTGAYLRLRLLQSLKENDRRKDLFLATLAHELRNPLAPILTGLDILNRTPEDPDILARVTGIIGRQTAQMVHLIDDLLDMSRVNTGKVILKMAETVLADVLNGAVEAARPLIDAKGHSLVLEMPAGMVRILVDPARLSQVVSNLLSNAAKYTPVNGRIRLEAGVAGPDLWITVRDNGQGIEAVDQVAVFDLFHQTSQGGEGLGIGLTLVKSLVELHGGSVVVRSAGRGQGSEFRVDIPGCVVASHPDEDQGPPAPGTKPGGKRILVVDDGKNAADVLAMFFRLEGMEVAVAYNGKDGLEKAREFDPDLVIMDVGMPVMDGLEAARHMRADHLRARLVALSGWGREEDKGRAAEAGFDDHLVKPAGPDDLRKLVAKWLG